MCDSFLRTSVSKTYLNAVGQSGRLKREWGAQHDNAGHHPKRTTKSNGAQKNVQEIRSVSPLAAQLSQIVVKIQTDTSNKLVCYPEILFYGHRSNTDSTRQKVHRKDVRHVVRTESASELGQGAIVHHLLYEYRQILAEHVLVQLLHDLC